MVSVTSGDTSSTVDDVELLEFVLKLLVLTETVNRSIIFGVRVIRCNADSDIEKLFILKIKNLSLTPRNYEKHEFVGRYKNNGILGCSPTSIERGSKLLKTCWITN